MWPKPPPGGFPVPPIYCPVSAQIICGPCTPLAKQPAPQSSLLSNSEPRIEGGPVVFNESPKKSKKEDGNLAGMKASIEDARIISSLSHPNIVRFKEVFHDRKQKLLS